jgi:hypothetical protein
MTQCGSCRNRRFGGTYRPHHQGQNNQRVRNVISRDLLVTVNAIPSSLIIFSLMMEAICSFEMLVLTRPTRRHNREDCILHSHRRENLKSYIALTGWTL